MPHKGHLNKRGITVSKNNIKGILVKVLSSSEDVTRAMRARNYLRRHGGNVVVYVLISFHSQRCFLPSQPSFCSAGLSFVLCSYCCSLFDRLFGFKEFN